MDEHVYPSKIDRWLSSLFTLSSAASVVACLAALATCEPLAWLLVSVVLLMAVGLPWWLIRGTDYTVTPDTLRIRSGPFRWSIALRNIRRITTTTNPLSSPALSLDRLRIEYVHESARNKFVGRTTSIMVSPADRSGFLADLVRRGVEAAQPPLPAD